MSSFKPPSLQSYTNETARSNNPALQTYNAIRQLVHDFAETSGTHIPGDQLSRFKIKGSTFDLKTGGGGPIHVRPMPIEELKTILTQKRPWDLFKLVQWEPKFAEKWTNIDIARELSNLFSNYLRCSNDDKVPGVIYNTIWRTRLPREEYERLMRFCEDEQYWHIDCIMESTTPESVPHIACFMLDNAPMLQDKFSRSEITCVMALTLDRMRLYAGTHPVFPVTVFSMSSRNFRVIHGYYNTDQDCFIIRKSEMLQFYEFELSTAALAISWMVAMPLPLAATQTGDSKPAVKSPTKAPMQSPAKENLPFRR